MEEQNMEIISGMKDKYLTFWVEQQVYGVAISDVVQIVQTQQITPIPEYPNFVQGIINLRGNIIPVVDVRMRLGKPKTEYDDHACIIITSIKGKYVGLAVEQVEEVTVIPEANISPAPSFSENNPEDFYLKGIGKQSERVVLLLEVQKFLSQSTLQTICSQETAKQNEEICCEESEK